MKISHFFKINGWEWIRENRKKFSMFLSKGNSSPCVPHLSSLTSSETFSVSELHLPSSTDFLPWTHKPTQGWPTENQTQNPAAFRIAFPLGYFSTHVSCQGPTSWKSRVNLLPPFPQPYPLLRASLVAQLAKNLPAMQVPSSGSCSLAFAPVTKLVSHWPEW